MKTLNIFLSSFAILIFSGCYTQLLIEDDVTTTGDPGPIYIPDPPQPVVYYPPYPVPDPQPPQNVHRESGYRRTGSNTTQQNLPDISRNSGATRGGDRSSSQQSSQDNSHVAVPNRESAATQTAIPQRGSQDNTATGRRGGR